MILLNLSLCLLCACCTVAHFCEHFLFWILWVCSYCIKLPVKMARLLIFFLYWVQLLRSNIILKIFIASLIQNIHIAGSVLVTYDLFPNVCIQLIISLYNSVFWLFVNICFSGHIVYNHRHNKCSKFSDNIQKCIHPLLITECPVLRIVLGASLLQL